MHKPRPWLSSITFSVAAFAASAASAAGLGSGGSAAVLGQPLDFVVQVRLDAGDTQALECVVAEVMVGERRLPAPLVRTTVDTRGGDGARIRVTTTLAIDEPVIGINLSAGCVSRISRRYVVLADPPLSAPAALPLPPSIEVAAAPAVESPSPSSSSVPVGVGVGVASAQRTADAVAEPGAPAAATSVPAVRRPVAQAGSRNKARAERRLARKPEPTQTAAAKSPRRTAKAGPPARLQLEMVAPAPAPGGERATVDEAIEAVAQAASAARAAASAASASAERLASMEGMVEQLRSEAKASRELAAQLRTRLIETDQSSRWTLPLAVLVLMLAALAAWLAWRLAAAQRERQQGWQAAALVPVAEPPGVADKMTTSAAPFVTAAHSAGRPMPARPRAKATPAWPPPAPAQDWAGNTTQNSPTTVASPAPTSLPAAITPTISVTPAAAEARRASAPAAPPPGAAESVTHRTEVLPANVRIEEGASRDVSIEELIDLEQQAEFFVVLGQDDSAVELLNEHVRSTGGGSPLPYLKLLEIHHRRSERKAYEAIRARFNQHFNAYAPEWGVGISAGRALSDYSGVIPRLQQVWARPLDAMAELEALLFRKSRGDLFDLPAYREVLFLYALARDLTDREAADSGDVDLLLPMADGSEFSTTAPAPYLALELAGEPEGPDEHPTLPLDFDLSVMDRPSSIFDQLRDPATRPGERG